jgi:predicted nucleotide-binding protein
MPKVTIFVASAGGAKSQAKAIITALSNATITFLPWWDAFTPGQTLLTDLDKIKKKVSGALVVMSPDVSAQVRGNDVEIPNQNVMFEFGYFYGALGPSKVAVMKYGNYYLPSDLGGYIHIPGSKFFRRGAVVQVGTKTKADFDKWIAQL